MRFSNSHTDAGKSEAGGDDIEVPTILDNGTGASEAAIERSIDRSVVSRNVPEEIQDEEFLNTMPTTREEEETMTPGEFYRAHYKPPVMVRFNTHVFGEPAPGESNDEDDNGPLEPTSPDSVYDDDETSDRKASTSSSFYAPERRFTDYSDFEFNDTVQHAVIDEEEEDSVTPRAVDSVSDPMLALPLRVVQAGHPALDAHDETSPASCNTELITPVHGDIPLPIPPRGSSDQGVPRPSPILDGRYTDRRFLPAKSSFRPSTAPTERPPNGLVPAATTILKRPKLIAPTPRNNTAEGLQLDTTGRRSIDVDHERAIEHAGGTPGRPSRALEGRNTPPVPPVPTHLLKLSAANLELAIAEHVLEASVIDNHVAQEDTSSPEVVREREIEELLNQMEDPDLPPCTSEVVAEAEGAEVDDEASPEPKPWPEDLANVNRAMTLELIVNQDSGVPVWCTLPVRRLSRPEYWQKKEDQELAKAIRWRDPPPKPQPFQQTGAVIFGEPSKRRTKWTFFYTSKSMPTLRGVMINDGTGKDHTRGVIKLKIKHAGVYHACGYDEAGQVEWMFQYLVTLRHGKINTRRQKRARVSCSSVLS